MLATEYVSHGGCSHARLLLNVLHTHAGGNSQLETYNTQSASNMTADEPQKKLQEQRGAACVPDELDELHAVDVEVDIKVGPRAAIGHDQLREVLHEERVGGFYVACHHVLSYGLPLPQSLHRSRIPLAPTAKG